jgi:tight adherence protein B
MLTFGALLLFLAAILLGVALVMPRTPQIAVDRRRPYESEAPSQLTRLTGSTVQVLDRYLEPRNARLFHRDALENAGLKLSQAEFIVLVVAGAVVGALLGLVIGLPVLSVFLVVLAPFAGHLVLSFLYGKRRAIPCSCWPEACVQATAFCGPSRRQLLNHKARRRKRCGA